MSMKYVQLLTGIISLLFFSNCKEKIKDVSNSDKMPETINFIYNEIEGIGFEKGVTRRDPSDIIKVDGVCYIYYTKVIGQASGYWGDIWYATSADNGYTWKEEGQILGVGANDSFDSHAVFTPNIMEVNGKYYMFYTGVKPTPGRTDGQFENNSTSDITALGLAVADAPNGQFKRIGFEPILEISNSPEKFDSYRIDDASLLSKNGKYLLYYKGRSRAHKANGPAHTMMGVAVADQPEGPYVKHPDPILDKSHEVMVWKQGEGIGALASISSTLEYSKSGFDFITDKKNISINKRPNAPGAYRADLTGGSSHELTWGISMIHNGADSYLVRFEAITKDNVFDKGSFGYDKTFLKKHYKNTIVLEGTNKNSMLVVSPELQGRVMTSTLNGDLGMSFGWLNYELIKSKEIMEHINPTGGEERFWLGPEGGQYSIFFAPKSSFEFKDWFVPSVLDTEAFDIIEQDSRSVLFHKEMELINYSGTEFNIDVKRKITLLNQAQINENLKLDTEDYSVIAYETSNNVKNIGALDWKKETGLLSIWLLSMISPTDETTVIIPVKQGTEEQLGLLVNDNYFGEIATDRLKTTEQTVFYKADGKSRGKIGVSPARSTGFMGSYDAKNKVLTILEIAEPNATDSYVNSAWELQDDPYSGDVLNSYNDGALEDGDQMGPFYELESSSPALALGSGESHTHTQRIYHFKGKKEILNRIAVKVLNVSIDEIQNAF